MAEALRAIIGWKSASLLQRGPVDPKFQVEGVAPINYSSSQKTRLNGLSYGIKIWTDLSTVLSQFTSVTDRRTDGQTEFSSLDSVCIPCIAVKRNSHISYGLYHSGVSSCHITVQTDIGVSLFTGPPSGTICRLLCVTTAGHWTRSSES